MSFLLLWVSRSSTAEMGDKIVCAHTAGTPVPSGLSIQAIKTNKQTKQSRKKKPTCFLNCGICRLLQHYYSTFSVLAREKKKLSSQNKIPRHHLNILWQAGLILFSFSKGNCHLDRNFLVLQTLRLQLFFFFLLKQRFFH